MSVLDFLETKGFTVEINGDKIRLLPSVRVTQEILEYARKHKQEIIDELKSRTERITTQDLSDSVIAVEIYSKDLGKKIYVCANENTKTLIKSEGITCCLPGELVRILKRNTASDYCGKTQLLSKGTKGQSRRYR